MFQTPSPIGKASAGKPGGRGEKRGKAPTTPSRLPEQGAGSGQRAAGSGQRAAGSRQRAGSGQQGAAAQRAGSSGELEGGNGSGKRESHAPKVQPDESANDAAAGSGTRLGSTKPPVTESRVSLVFYKRLPTVTTVTFYIKSPVPPAKLRATTETAHVNGHFCFPSHADLLVDLLRHLINGTFVLFFGANIVYFLFGRRPLSALGLVHIFQRRKLVDKWNEDFPAWRTEGGTPGSESAGVVAFIREGLIDLDDTPSPAAPDVDGQESGSSLKSISIYRDIQELSILKLSVTPVAACTFSPFLWMHWRIGGPGLSPEALGRIFRVR
ncbi:hypothetical protein B0H13DRAFT_1880158 [Mycena leptocephala]|nr:hypothetical protein B0H13DRAFT_1880158 [Mycena leptocephala]